jgi:adenosylmethionine-8-amino-7-oxononanoate aminotransferase
MLPVIPVILNDGRAVPDTASQNDGANPDSSNVLHHSLRLQPHKVVAAEGLYLTLSNGQKILDATGGAAVSCLGHGKGRVKEAINRQGGVVSYCHTPFYSTQVAEDLATELCAGTGGKMTKAFIVSSGELICPRHCKNNERLTFDQGPRRWKQR